MATMSLVQKLVPQTGYNAASAAGNNGTIDRQDFTQPIATANSNVQNNIANQNSFAQALQTQMNGGGPNLANSLLSNATGQNVSNQAALMASQRGTGSNAGLIARQAAQAGAATQQAAAGQASVNRQNQQLGAESGLASTYGQIGNEAGQNLSTQQQAQANQNYTVVGATNSANATNAGIAVGNTQNQMAALQGIGQAAVGALAEGGSIDEDGVHSSKDYSSELPEHLRGVSEIYHKHMSHKFAKGGKVKALVSPGEKILEPKDVKKFAEGKGSPMELGKTVPGKPKVPGPINSYANDTVPKNLKVNSVVVPRSETQSKNPDKNSAKFVRAVIENQGKKKKGAK
jgi:hypothetical protein